MSQFDKLVPFTVSGAVKDIGHFTGKKQSSEERRLVKHMRRHSHVPVLDIVPIVSYDYNADKEIFKYDITMYGYFVGSESWDYIGWLNGRLMPNTSGSKFEPSLTH